MYVAGLGVFEYFQLAEELGAEPLWVINNGISHTYSVPAEQIWPLVQVTVHVLVVYIADTAMRCARTGTNRGCKLCAWGTYV